MHHELIETLVRITAAAISSKGVEAVEVRAPSELSIVEQDGIFSRYSIREAAIPARGPNLLIATPWRARQLLPFSG